MHTSVISPLRAAETRHLPACFVKPVSRRSHRRSFPAFYSCSSSFFLVIFRGNNFRKNGIFQSKAGDKSKIPRRSVMPFSGRPCGFLKCVCSAPARCAVRFIFRQISLRFPPPAAPALRRNRSPIEASARKADLFRLFLRPLSDKRKILRSRSPPQVL